MIYMQERLCISKALFTLRKIISFDNKFINCPI